MYFRLSLLLVTTILFSFMPRAGHAQTDCKSIGSIGEYWYQTAERLDRSLSAASGMSRSEGSHIDAAMEEIWPATIELADWLKAQKSRKAKGLGKQLNQDLDMLLETAEWDLVLGEMDRVVETIDAIVATCKTGWSDAKKKRQKDGVNVSFHAVSAHPEMVQILVDSNIFQQLADSVNDMLVLPTALPVVFTGCASPTAFYDPATRQVTMCYELLLLAAVLADANNDSDEGMAEAMLGTGAFFMLHEIGHALVHMLKLPITGSEEDSVDNLATLILLSGDETDETAVFAALQNFWALANQVEAGSSKMPFWDEHSLNTQRMFDLACLVYGSDPQRFGNLVGEDGLPRERAVRCPAEYEQKNRAWSKLLKPHYRAN
jgi:hypothetical protein